MTFDGGQRQALTTAQQKPEYERSAGLSTLTAG
jgi:hypothetical protein